MLWGSRGTSFNWSQTKGLEKEVLIVYHLDNQHGEGTWGVPLLSVRAPSRLWITKPWAGIPSPELEGYQVWGAWVPLYWHAFCPSCGDCCLLTAPTTSWGNLQPRTGPGGA